MVLVLSFAKTSGFFRVQDLFFVDVGAFEGKKYCTFWFLGLGLFE